MPVIKKIDSVKICMYFFDHNPPHFHAVYAVYAEYEELIIIGSLETYSGGLPAMQRKKVFKWASEHQKFLVQKWNEFNPD